MFWECISADGRRDIVCCTGSMDSVTYYRIFYKAFTKKFFVSNNIDVLQNFPPCSAELNIIENIWAILKRNVQRHSAKNLQELRHFVYDEFNKISDTVIVNLYESMPRHISDVLLGKHY